LARLSDRTIKTLSLALVAVWLYLNGGSGGIICSMVALGDITSVVKAIWHHQRSSLLSCALVILALLWHFDIFARYPAASLLVIALVSSRCYRVVSARYPRCCS
jgi:hypothetical protein